MNPFFKKLVLNAWTSDLNEFEELVRKGKEAGLTHVNMGRLTRRTEYVDKDNERNPWTEWSVILTSFFKFFQPQELGEVYDESFVKEQMDSLKAKHEIVARYGLKGAFIANDPMWLPNKVYLKHPQWRGVRGDNSLRTRDLLYSPCVDNPEVRRLYQKTISEIVKAAPTIDTFILMGNDAGAVFCWVENAYAGQNGPSWCADVDMGTRVTGFLNTIRQGANDAGIDATAFIGERNFSVSELAAIRGKLKPGIGMIGAPQANEPEECFMGTIENWTDVQTYINKMPYPFSCVESMHRARQSGQQSFLISRSLGQTDPAIFTALKLFCQTENTDSLMERFTVIRNVAAKEFAPEVAEEVLEGWYNIQRSKEIAVRLSFAMGSFANRWLVRPILGTQEKLTEEEISYFKRWVYQIKPDGYKDYMNTHRRRLVESYTHACHVGSIAEAAEEPLIKAAAIFRKAKEKVTDSALQEKLELNALRADAQRCMIRNYHCTVVIAAIQYERQKYADRFTEETDPAQPSWPQGSCQLSATYKMMRQELDNTYELINVLEKAPEPIFLSARDKSQEGYFRYGPDLVEQLEKKAELMQKHWRDVEELYFRPMRGT